MRNDVPLSYATSARRNLDALFGFNRSRWVDCLFAIAFSKIVMEETITRRYVCR